MKKIITLALVTLSMNVMALDLQAYKDGETNGVILNDSSVEQVFPSNTPVCLKDGSKILGVNKEFKKLALGYRDCSNGISATRKHKALGYKVTVIKLAELSDNMIKQVLGKK